jgi:protein phosphatase
MKKKASPKAPAAVRAATLRWFGWTDAGRVRKNNEDSFLGLRFDAHEVHRLGKFGEASTAKHDFTFAVCDGMGGAKAGEYASQIATEKITTLLPRAFQQSASGLNAGFSDVLTELFAQIHRALVYLGGSYEECHGMQTTMSLCWFTPGWMYFGHVGDTRVYHLPPKKTQLLQLTADDTHIGWLLRNGKIGEYEARTHPRRNVLQKALGGENQFVAPQVGAVGCGQGDIFLLCSDGLTEGLHNHNIVDILRAKDTDSNPAKTLVASAVTSDGRDNTTALVVQVV